MFSYNEIQYGSNQRAKSAPGLLDSRITSTELGLNVHEVIKSLFLCMFICIMFICLLLRCYIHGY